MPEILLDVRSLTHRYAITGKSTLTALDGVTFQIRRGEIFGLVGQSGSGKSTAARCIMNLLRPTGGKLLYKGVDLLDPKQRRANRKMLQTTRQLIFQDSGSSLNPRMTLAELITEPLAIHRVTSPRGSMRAEAELRAKSVGLSPSCLDRFPPELSGGQRQRAAIARALCMEPELLIADEPVASLDVSVQAQILNLFRHLQERHGFSLLFIAHDMSAVRWLCSRVGVLCRGRLVEAAPVPELFENPLHPCTRALLSSVPLPDPRRERERQLEHFDADTLPSAGTLYEASPDHFVLKED